MRSTWKPNHNYNNALISSRCTYLGCMISSLRCSRASSFSWSFRRRCWVPFKPSPTASTVLWSQADWMTLGKVLLLSEPFISSIKWGNSISLISLRQGWNVILYANDTPNASCVQEVLSKCDPPQSTCASRYLLQKSGSAREGWRIFSLNPGSAPRAEKGSESSEMGEQLQHSCGAIVEEEGAGSTVWWDGETTRLGITHTCVWILPLALSHCRTLGNSLQLSKLSFLTCHMGKSPYLTQLLWKWIYSIHMECTEYS